MKGIPCINCKDCPYWSRSYYHTIDSWEEADYWWCMNPDNEDVKESDEIDEGFRKAQGHGPTRMIQGYVEWHDEKHIDIPSWCKLPEIKEN